MKKYNIYHYTYDFDYGCFDREYVDTICIEEHGSIFDGIRQVKLDHDLYNTLDQKHSDVWELTSRNTYDYYLIIPKGKYQ